MNDKEKQADELCMFARWLDARKRLKPKNIKTFADLKIGFCPVCGDGSNSEFNYCPVCGQKLDWSAESEEVEK